MHPPRFWRGLAAGALLASAGTAALAESRHVTALPAGAALSAQARLDFRVTVLPSLRLEAGLQGTQASLNTGALVLTREGQTHWRAPTGRRVSQRQLALTLPAGGAGWTVASP